MRSIDWLEEIYLAAFDQGRHSQNKKYWYRSTILRCLPSYPSTVAMKILSWQNKHRRRPSQDDTVTLKTSILILDSYRYSCSYTAFARMFFSQQLLHGHNRLQNFTSQPYQQIYGNTDSCKNSHQILSPGNRKICFTLVSRPSYGKYRTRAKVYLACTAMCKLPSMHGCV